jgi:hypothetical protein
MQLHVEECSGVNAPIEKVVTSLLAATTCPSRRFYVHMEYLCIARHPGEITV